MGPGRCRAATEQASAGVGGSHHRIADGQGNLGDDQQDEGGGKVPGPGQLQGDGGRAQGQGGAFQGAETDADGHAGRYHHKGCRKPPVGDEQQGHGKGHQPDGEVDPFVASGDRTRCLNKKRLVQDKDDPFFDEDKPQAQAGSRGQSAG